MPALLLFKKHRLVQADIHNFFFFKSFLSSATKKGCTNRISSCSDAKNISQNNIAKQPTKTHRQKPQTKETNYDTSRHLQVSPSSLSRAQTAVTWPSCLCAHYRHNRTHANRFLFTKLSLSNAAPLTGKGPYKKPNTTNTKKIVRKQGTTKHSP